MITVKDIREKEFGRQKHGYHEDEVDDFLDEIADQMEALIRENRAMMQKVEAAQAAQARAEAALKDAVQSAPVVQAVAPERAPALAPAPSEESVALADDSIYFKNLETTLRETLISAQRIADQTTAEAKMKAEKAVNEAEQYAQALREDAQKETEALRISLEKQTKSAQADFEKLKQAATDYRTRFMSLVEAQMKAFKDGEE